MEANNSKAVQTDNPMIKNLLNNKTTRNSTKHKHHSNRKKELIRQLEFYFSDINLLNDKFLRNLINKDCDKGVDINVILNFNKVKNIMKGVEEQESKIKLLKKSVEQSKKIKIYQNKIIRKEKFESDKLNQKEIDKRTIYVENLPKEITHDILYKVSTKYGKVLHIAIPKYSETKKSKGFAFLIFDSEENAAKAIKELNNSIPKEFFSLQNESGLQPLSIISKEEWLNKKEEFKRLKNELMKENKDLFAECFRQDSESITNLKENTLVKLSELPNKKIDKYDLKIWISHFVEPAYVDYKKNEDFCIVRFSHPILAENFVNKIKSEDEFSFHGKKLTANVVKGEEERIYLENVQKLKVEFKRKKNKKISN